MQTWEQAWAIQQYKPWLTIRNKRLCVYTVFYLPSPSILPPSLPSHPPTHHYRKQWGGYCLERPCLIPRVEWLAITTLALAGGLGGRGSSLGEHGRLTGNNLMCSRTQWVYGCVWGGRVSLFSSSRVLEFKFALLFHMIIPLFSGWVKEVHWYYRVLLYLEEVLLRWVPWPKQTH